MAKTTTQYEGKMPTYDWHFWVGIACWVLFFVGFICLCLMV